MRKFEKISFKQFNKDICNDIKLYKEFNMPSRATNLSAGYDFYSLKDFTLKPGQIIKIPTGIKVMMENDEYLLLCVRSSQGFKYNIRLCNQIGIIDKDYYNNPENEGHIWIALQNEGNDNYTVKKGEAIVQGIFMKYFLIEDDRLELSNNNVKVDYSHLLDK